MPEQRREVRTIQVLMMCDRCDGEMVYINDGRVLLSDPPQYRHECRSGCGNVQYYPKSYPSVEYEYPPIKYITTDDLKQMIGGK